MSTSILLLGVLFGSLGFGYFLYARKQREPIPLVCGMVLMACPYFIANAWALFVVGCITAIIPWVIRL